MFIFFTQDDSEGGTIVYIFNQPVSNTKLSTYSNRM
jgi:hypothetical protein